MEFSPDPQRHEERDERLRYVAYVPPGSIAGGRSIARLCATCHGPGLRGIGLVPPLAGRSPSYLLRSLLAIRTAARAGATGQPMRTVTAALDLPDFIDIAAYAASLPP
jgi:cytochrome c553